jgi:hypothetical protein
MKCSRNKFIMNSTVTSGQEKVDARRRRHSMASIHVSPSCYKHTTAKIIYGSLLLFPKTQYNSLNSYILKAQTVLNDPTVGIRH